MPGLLDVGSIVSDLVESVGKVADDLFTSDAERKKAQRLMKKLDVRFREKMLDVKRKLIEQRGAAVKAEIQGEGWLQRSWRPLSMLAFVLIIGLHWLGVAGQHLDPELAGRLYSLVKLGLGGYVIGRSAEKIAPHAERAFSKRQTDA